MVASKDLVTALATPLGPMGGKPLVSLSVSTRPGQRASGGCKKAWKNILIVPLSVLLLLSMSLASVAYGQEGARQDFGSGGLFTYVPPSGWKVSEFPGMKFKICVGQPTKGFAPNINVVDEADERSLDDYVQVTEANAQNFFQGLKTVSQTDFSTAEGARSIKVVTERDDPQVKKRLHQIYYFFDAGSRKLVATCTTLAEDAEAFEKVFDAAMKTFTVTKK